jgi:hypothetical protein
MLKKHILHIGFPRCGSTWLWHNIFHYLDQSIDFYDKENQILFQTADLEKYSTHYKKYQVSANMNPNTWMLDQSIIRSLNPYVTHVSCILRNPFEFTERYCNFISMTDPITAVDFVLTQGMLQYSTIYQRWRENFNGKLKFFLFEDLENDGTVFYREIVDFYNFDLYNTTIPKTLTSKINSNSNNQKLFFSKHQTNVINDEINKFSKVVNRSLSHWLR